MDQVAGTDTSQTIVRGQVFLDPPATVHWHFYKKDCRASAKEREAELRRQQRDRE